MALLNDVCDYVITQVVEAGEPLSNLKLQKLLYYIQAWHLAFEDKKLFNGRFEAWVHGPVSREIYNRFISTKSMYSDMLLEDRKPDFSPGNLSSEERSHIDNVLSIYAKFSGHQLEEMTHKEEPWIAARNGLDSWARCTDSIDEALMQSCYKARLG